MRKLLLTVLSILLSINAFSEEKSNNSAMQSAYKSFKEIQKIIYTNDTDRLLKSRENLLTHVTSLQDSLRKFKQNNKSNKLLAFDDNLLHLMSEIDSVQKV